MNLTIGLYGYFFLYSSHNPFSCRAFLAVFPLIRGNLHTQPSQWRTLTFHPVQVWKVWLLKVRWSLMAFRFSLRNSTMKRSPFNRSAYSVVKCQRNDSRLLFNHLHQTYLTRHSEKATRADSTTSHFIMLVTLLWDWSSVLIYHIIRLGLQSAFPHNLISHVSSR